MVSRVPTFIVLLLCLFILPLTTSGTGSDNEYWKKDYSRIDSIARSVKRTADLEKLAHRLTEHCTSDVEKYRSIFAWIAYNIAYDVEALNDKDKRKVEPKDLVKKGKSVCQGYANLFQELCRISLLECIIITGQAKQKADIGKKDWKDTNHAWNAIRIGSEWFLCDVTWGAGSVDSDFRFEFKDYYFCTPPVLFAYNHYPEDTRWLLGVELSKEIFNQKPYFYPSAIAAGVEEIEPAIGTIRFKKGDSINFSFKTTSTVRSILVDGPTNKKSEKVGFVINDGVVHFSYRIDTFSPYITIYANEKAFLAYKVQNEKHR